MKLLFDQNLSPKLVARLADIFPQSTHVHLVELDQKDDATIWGYADAHEYTIVSKDTDFADYSAAFGFPPPTVILIQTGNCATSDVENLLRRNELTIREMLETGTAGSLTLF